MTPAEHLRAAGFDIGSDRTVPMDLYVRHVSEARRLMARAEAIMHGQQAEIDRLIAELADLAVKK